MKKWIVALSICTLLTCSLLTIPVKAAEPTIRLPSLPVTMTPDHDGTLSWFNFTLTEVPSGYDITDGVYPGWCVQKYKEMDPGPNHYVVLKSCFADNLINGFENIDWEKMNYIINHKQGKGRISVQMAIWNFTDDISYEGYPGAWAIVNDTLNNSAGYVPGPGEILAIPIEGATGALQLSFLELTIPIPSNFEGLVWYDTNADGLQGASEPGKKDVTVQLYKSNGTLSQTTTTTAQGSYIYTNVPPGEYYIQFTLPSGYVFSPKDAGSNDALDSDANTATGKTIPFNVTADQSITIWDAGMYTQTSGETPSPPPGEEPTKNVPPTADATAGEPYRGFINGTITFDGSRSYDYDGRIITWRWTFGDGTNGTGEVTTHSYALPGNYTVTLFVTDNDFAQRTYVTYARITLGNNPPGVPDISGSTSGHVGTSYQYTVLGTDSDGDNLRYVIDWDDGLQDTTEPTASGESVLVTHHWSSAGFYAVQVTALDTYNATSAPDTMTIAIDVRYAGDLGYFIDVDGDGVYDKFHSNETGVETDVNIQQGTDNYLIDTNGDGSWDNSYDPATGQAQKYSGQPVIQYAIIVLVILLIAFIVVYFLVRNRRRSRTISKNQNNMDNTKRP